VKHNLSNQSLEININTQYSKKNNGNMSKKVNFIVNLNRWMNWKSITKVHTLKK
jgi:hypothetical protein